MFKRVEIICLLKQVRGFAPCCRANVRQRHLALIINVLENN